MAEPDTDAADMIAFYRARLDEDERNVRDRLCLNCGNPVAPLVSALGVTGYTHDGVRANTQGGWEQGWEGRRCPGKIVGAEPVQNPARVLAEVEAHRAIVDAYLPPGGDPHPGLPCTDDVEGDPDGEIYAEMVFPDACVRHIEASKRLLHHDYVIRLLVAVHSDHPDYKDAWRP